MMIRVNTISQLAAIVAMLCTIPQNLLFAQEQSLPELRAQHDQELTQLQSLRRIVRSLNNIDTAYAAYLPVWSVLDQTLRLKTFDAFRNRKIAFREDEEVLIVATPDTQDIVDIRIGESSYGRLYTKTVLDRNLKQELLRQTEYASEEQTPSGYRRSSKSGRAAFARPVTPGWVSANISLFGGEIRFGNDWSVVGKVGDDVLGYPFWSSGQAWLMLKYRSIALGVRLPVHGGLDDFTLGLRTRRLNGSTGIVGEFEFEWDLIKIQSANFSYGGVGGSFSVGKLSDRRPELLTANLNNLYSISTFFESHYSFDYQFDHTRQLLNARVGIGYHRVTISKQDNLEIVKADEPLPFIHPFITVEYKHQRADWFRIGAGLSRLAMITAWAELIPGFVFAEIKYSAVVLREAKPWEHKNYIYGTLGFNFDF